MKDKIKLDQIEKNPEKIERINYHFQTLLKDLALETPTLEKLVTEKASLVDLANINYLHKSHIISKNNTLAVPLFRNFLINTKGSKLSQHNEVVNDKIIVNSKLTAQEYKILKYLTGKLNQFCTRDEIIDGVWGTKSEKGISDHALDQIIYRLRKKLEKNDPQIKIETIWGRGHKAVLTS